jgi:hypothetical protein
MFLKNARSEELEARNEKPPTIKIFLLAFTSRF